MIYTALFIRIIYLLIIGIIGFTVLFAFRKKLKKWEKAMFSLLIVVLLLYGGTSTVYHLINPEIENIKGTFQMAVRRNGINPFEYEYCFEDNDGNKYYIDMDAISKKYIFPNELVKEKLYSVNYEANENLILSIEEIN